VSADLPCIARKTDHIVHDGSQAAAFEAWFLTNIAGAAAGIAVAIIFAPAGVTALVALGVMTVVEWGLTEVATSHIQARALEQSGPAVPEIATGSRDVWVNGLQAARGPGAMGPDKLACRDHGQINIAQGSSWVLVNLSPAARYKDRTECPGGAHLTFGARPTKPVYVGGPPTAYDNRMPAHRYAVIPMMLLRAGTSVGVLRSIDLPTTFGRELRNELAGYVGGEGLTASNDWWRGANPTLPGAPIPPTR
jgi:uncharacterized Zn-binding protein involved in type VI secretion